MQVKAPKEIYKIVTQKDVFQIKQGYSDKIKFKYPNIKIGIIIPAYNEEMNIRDVLLKIPNDLSNKLDVIVIDDGSKDRTCEIARKYNSIVLEHNENKGNGAATITGLKYCEKNQYDVCVILDADGQHNPQYINKFIEPIIFKQVDFTIGNRFKYYYHMSPLRKLCTKLLTVFYFINYNKKISDPTNGYRALSLKLIRNLNLESNYSITQEMLLKILSKYNYIEVPIKVNQRENGESFIKLNKYLTKMISFVIFFFLLPRIKNMIRIFLNKNKD